MHINASHSLCMLFVVRMSALFMTMPDVLMFVAIATPSEDMGVEGEVD